LTFKALNISEKKEEAREKKSYCKVLRTHFLRSSNGVPKFEVKPQGNSFLALVTMPDGAKYWGVPSETRQDSMESAALQVGSMSRRGRDIG